MTVPYNPLLDGDYFHNDDVKVLGPATIRGQELDRIKLVTFDKDKVVARNIGYIRESIALRKAREEKENQDSAGN